jgi:hypothetical protein
VRHLGVTPWGSNPGGLAWQRQGLPPSQRNTNDDILVTDCFFSVYICSGLRNVVDLLIVSRTLSEIWSLLNHC